MVELKVKGCGVGAHDGLILDVQAPIGTPEEIEEVRMIRESLLDAGPKGLRARFCGMRGSEGMTFILDDPTKE